MLLLNKLKLPAVVLLAVGVIAGAAVALPQQPPADKPKAEPLKAVAKDELKWKLGKGDVFYLTVATEADVTLLPPKGVKPFPLSTQKRGTAVWKVTVTAASKDGLGVEVEAVSYTAGQGAERKAFETTEVKGMAGGKFTATFDADRKVKAVSDGEALDKAAAAARGAGLSVPPTEVVANSLEQLFRLVPASPPGKEGEWEWAAESTHPQTLLVTTWARRAKLDGIKDGVATVTTEADYQVTAGPKTKEPFLNVMIHGNKCGGSFTFDTRTGRLDTFEETILTGSPPGVGGNPDALGNKCTTRTTYTVTAKPPKKD